MTGMAMRPAGAPVALGAAAKLVMAAALAITAALAMAATPTLALAQAPGAALPGSAGPLTDLSIDEIADGVGPGGDGVRARVAIVERMHARPSGPDATLWVQLLDVVGEVAATSAREAVRAVGMAVETDQSARATDMVMDAADGTEGTERAALLSLAAHLAERGDRRRAAEIRGTLLSEYPNARQAPEAQLLRARWMLASSDLRDEGMALLEDLIVSRPDHPITPEARRLYRVNEEPDDAL